MVIDATSPNKALLKEDESKVLLRDLNWDPAA